MELEQDEITIRESNGGCRVNSRSPYAWNKGKCYLTNKRLIFRSDLENLEKREAIIPLEDIIAINAKPNDFLHTNISFLLKNNTIVEFGFRKNRSDWLNDIGAAIKEIKKETDKHWELHQILNIKTFNKKADWSIPIKSILIQSICFVAAFLGLYFLHEHFNLPTSLICSLVLLILSIYVWINISKKGKLSQKVQAAGFIISCVILNGLFVYNAFISNIRINILFIAAIFIVPIFVAKYFAKHLADKEESVNLLNNNIESK